MIGARRITVPAMLAALSLILMLVSGTLDTGKLGTLVLLSFLPMVLISEGGWLPAVASYGATLLCGLVLLPDKTMPLAYGLFFGLFAFIWQGLQRLSRPWIRFLLALCVFNAAWFIGLVWIQRLWSTMPFAWIYLTGQPVFILYYFCYGYAVRYYQRFWALRVHQWMGGRG